MFKARLATIIKSPAAMTAQALGRLGKIEKPRPVCNTIII